MYRDSKILDKCVQNSLIEIRHDFSRNFHGDEKINPICWFPHVYTSITVTQVSLWPHFILCYYASVQVKYWFIFNIFLLVFHAKGSAKGWICRVANWFIFLQHESSHRIEYNIFWLFSCEMRFIFFCLSKQLNYWTEKCIFWDIS